MNEINFGKCCFIVAMVCTFLVCVTIVIVNTFSENDNNTYFLVPDPIAAKEGENQWLQLSSNEVKHTNANKVKYVINGVTYTTTVYIECNPQ